MFGPFLVFPMLILVEELLEPRLLRSGRVMKLALFVVFSLGVLFAYSRAAWLNAAVAALTMLAVFALRRGGGRKAFVLVGTIAVAITVFFGAIVLSGSGDFLEERAPYQAYDEDRFTAQRTGIELAVSYPLGIGPGRYEGVVGYAAHSTYVRTLAEQGFLGLLAVVLLFLLTLELRHGTRSPAVERSGSDRRPYSQPGAGRSPTVFSSTRCTGVICG